MINPNIRILTGALLVLSFVLNVAATPLSFELDIRIPVCKECPIGTTPIPADQTPEGCNLYPRPCCPHCRKFGCQFIFRTSYG